MALRQYVNNLNKELFISASQIERNLSIQFQNGYFETDNEQLQQLIERNNAFGTTIHFKDSIAEMERVGKEREEIQAADQARQIDTVLALLEEADAADTDDVNKDEAAAARSAKRKKALGKLKAAKAAVGGSQS